MGVQEKMRNPNSDFSLVTKVCSEVFVMQNSSVMQTA